MKACNPSSEKQELLSTERSNDCPCQSRSKILIVDDNVFNVMTLEMMINHSLNQEVDKALNGKEAVDQFLKRAAMDPCHCHRNTPLPYQLVFMDCNMPVMDGFQATAEIRRLFPDA